MGKNKARHILHGVLDCLPIILIPIFMIYSQNHEINDNNLTLKETKVVDLNQMAKPLTNSAISFNDTIITYTASTNVTSSTISLTESYPYLTNHKILVKAYLDDIQGSFTQFYINYNFTNPWTSTICLRESDSIGTNFETIITNSTAVDNCNQRFVIYGTYSNDFVIKLRLQCFDLTNMFGAGNEPTTTNQFDYYLPQTYYDFTLSTPIGIEDKLFTYDDSDIMSQSFYCLYNAVDKYFNMGNVFGMKNFYTWFEVNIFGGSASPSIYIVWNIVLYEFIMDLLFLLYGLFMFFIDLCKRLMEKPLNSIK